MSEEEMHIFHRHKWCHEDNVEILDILWSILDVIVEIRSRLFPPVSASIYFEGECMADITVTVGDAAQTATVTFFDGDAGSGNVVPPQSVPVWETSDGSVVSVDASADPSGLTAVVTFGAEGAAMVTASSTNTDGTVVSATASVTVQAAPPPPPAAPVSAEITFA